MAFNLEDDDERRKPGCVQSNAVAVRRWKRRFNPKGDCFQSKAGRFNDEDGWLNDEDDCFIEKDNRFNGKDDRFNKKENCFNTKHICFTREADASAAKGSRTFANPSVDTPYAGISRTTG